MKVLLLLAVCLPFITCQTMVGGQVPYQTDLSDPNVVFAVSGINSALAANGDTRTRSAVRLLSATSQVVSGVIFRYKIEVTGGDSNEACNVAVWSQPWLTGDDALKLEGTPTCIALSSRAGALGGEQPIDFTDDGVRNALAFFENDINKMTNSLYYLKATGSGTITQQVVNGIIYRLNNVALAQSSCTVNTGMTDPNAVCTVDASVTPLLKCNAEIYWNPRQTPAYVLQSKACFNN